MKSILFMLGLALGITTDLMAAGTLRLRMETDRGMLLEGQAQEVVIKIDLEAAAGQPGVRRPPFNLAVVLDRSGSMTGAKLERAKQAALELVDRLRPEDVLSLVAYSDGAQVFASCQRITEADNLKRCISRMTASGRTALYSGVKIGADQVRECLSSKRINRVLLLSDGLANVGPSSTADLRRLGCELAAAGIAVTTVGLGDDYNEDLMVAIAEASDANYYYVRDAESLPAIFAKELGELCSVAARDIEIEVTCPAGVAPIGFIGHRERFEGSKATVRLSHLVGGQARCLFLRCNVTDPVAPEIAKVRVCYRDELDGGTEQTVNEAARVRFTTDEGVAGRSVNAAVLAESELVITAVKKEEALAAADAGDLRKVVLCVVNGFFMRVVHRDPTRWIS